MSSICVLFKCSKRSFFASVLILSLFMLAPNAQADSGRDNGWGRGRYDWGWWNWLRRHPKHGSENVKPTSTPRIVTSQTLTPTPTCTVTPEATLQSPTATPTKGCGCSLKTPTPTLTAIPSYTPTLEPTQTPEPTSTPHFTATQTKTATMTPTSTPTPQNTATSTPRPTFPPLPTFAPPMPTPKPTKVPCVLNVSRRGKHVTSRWAYESSPFWNISYPNTVTLTIGTVTAGIWYMDPCNRNYGALYTCNSWRADPPAWYQVGSNYYNLVAGGAIGGECSVVVGQLVSPLVIDFKMNGVEFTDAPTARFNYGKGHEPTYWIKNSSDVGFLAIDKNRNRRIDNINELFGDKTANDEGEQKFGNGFEALAKYDSDRNGEINKRDKDFERLRIWFDRNSDGKTNRGELQRLTTLGIEAISLKYEYFAEFADKNGNLSLYRSMVFLKGNPPSGVGIYDVYFTRVPRVARR